jgi:hypothetical protein
MDFGNISGIFRVFLVFWELVLEYDHPGSTGKIRILEVFWVCLGFIGNFRIFRIFEDF